MLISFISSYLEIFFVWFFLSFYFYLYTTDRGVTALAASVLQRFFSASDTGTLLSNLVHKDRWTADPEQKNSTRSAKRSSFFHKDHP